MFTGELCKKYTISWKLTVFKKKITSVYKLIRRVYCFFQVVTIIAVYINETKINKDYLRDSNRLNFFLCIK